MPLHKLESNVGGKLTAKRAARAMQHPPRPGRKERVTLGVIVGNRGFFPGHLARTGREDMLKALAEEGIDAIALGPDDSVHGAVESRDEAKACAALFRANADKIAGVIVTLPNFGDERAIAETLRMAGLNVPVLIHATADDPARMGIDVTTRRVLRQDVRLQRPHAVRHSLLAHFTAHSAARVRKLPRGSAQLHRVCRVVRGLRHARIGAIGARPAAFKTVRLQREDTRGLGNRSRADRSVGDPRPNRSTGERRRCSCMRNSSRCEAYVTTDGIPSEALIKMAKLGLVIDRWMAEADVTVSAIQCWTSMEEFFGVVPCTIMSMMSDVNLPSACEMDVCGTISMYALTLASETPSALLDWNNNYGDDPEQGRVLPLQQPAEGVLRRRADGLSGDHRRYGGTREHLRYRRGQGEGKSR